MAKPVEIISAEQFRNQCNSDFQEFNKKLSEWFEHWRYKESNKHHPLREWYCKPWAEEGRRYINFPETFYHTLHWYKTFKISRFRELGWKLDDKAVMDIKSKFDFLIESALKELAASGSLDSKLHDYFRKYDSSHISRYTAIDYKFETITGMEINNVLDFGSGIGRQSFQWCPDGRINFFSIDAIESLYILQNAIYALLFPGKLRDYFYDPQKFIASDFQNSRGDLWHMPTWRMDLLPVNYFDIIVCVQVLQELNEQTLQYVLSQFSRIARKNGLLYIRDNEFWKPAHKLRIGRALLKHGWEIIFKYSGKEGEDIEGVPRLWVFTGKDNSKSFRFLTRLKHAFLPSYPYSYSSWMDCGLPI